MKPELQRIKIAEACGFAKDWDFKRAVPHNGWCIDGLPDYLNDLNAMHEVEMTLEGMQQISYLAKLHENNHYCSWGGTCATAAQRAEAFLKTINIWEE